MDCGGDFKTLGLPPGSSWDEVKSAFRRLARMYHPDIAGPGGARKFSEITEAYMSLKGAISPEASRGVPQRSGYGDLRTERQENVRAGDSGGDSFWKRLWARLIPRGGEKSEAKAPPQDFSSFSSARVRFVGSAISKAESQIEGLLSRREELKEKNRTDAIICRLRSKHPAVALLALQQISLRGGNDEIRAAALEHFTKNIPATEVLMSLLSLFGGSGMEQNFTKALAAHARSFSPSDAQVVLRWLKRQDADKGCFSPFLSHPSHSVAAAVLNGWPSSFGLPETSDISNLLKTGDEAALVPLLRLLRSKGAPVWAISQITRISSDHTSPAVRVWASAIVRDRNLG